MNSKKNVDEYIANAAKETQGKLKELRSLIQTLAPLSQEYISYGMPFYEYKGRLIYFAAMKNYIGLYIPPPIIDNHINELKKYKTTKSAVHFAIDEKLPVELIQTLVKARMKWNEESERKKQK